MRASATYRSRGQAMVEFALVAPIFFLLLFLIIEGGRFIFYYELLNNATREGARYAIVHGGNSFSPSGPPAPDTTSPDVDGSDVVDAARRAAIGLIGPGELSAAPPVWWDCASEPPMPGDASTGSNDRGQCITVFLDYSYNAIIPVLPSITITAESSLVINN